MFTKKPYRAVGMMSGTSLDGIDVAKIVTDGDRIFEFGRSAYHAYDDDHRSMLQAGLGRWPDPELDPLQQLVERLHIEAAQGFSADILGFHGQTLAHDPASGRTHQIGNGQILANHLGLPVAWDFRSRDVAHGGQGAPLAPFFHFACAKYCGVTEPIAVLNLGGVGNITYVDPSYDDPAENGAVLAFDTGPANAPINDAMMARFGRPYDENGQTATQGRMNADAVRRTMALDYFAAPAPKSLDRDDFAQVMDWFSGVKDADVIATLTHIVVDSVIHAVGQLPKRPSSLWVTGGGRKNPVIMSGLSAGLSCPVIPIEAVGLDGDMLEAQAFGYLAVRVARGMPISAPMTTGVAHPMGGGQIAQPQSRAAAGPT